MVSCFGVRIFPIEKNLLLDPCLFFFFGPDKMLFATDAPLGPPFGLTLETIHSVERMNIPDFEKEKIFEENAVNLLRMAI